jgi:hypothetical protein
MSLDGYVAPARGAPDHRRSRAEGDQARLACRGRDARDGTRHLRGDGGALVDVERCVRGADERAAEGGVLEDPERADCNDSRVARGDLAAEIAALRREPGGDIIAWGGASFVQALSRQASRTSIAS